MIDLEKVFKEIEVEKVVDDLFLQEVINGSAGALK